MRIEKFKVAQNRQPWNGFNLARGHLFGRYEGVLYVSTAAPDSYRPGYIKAYRHSRTQNVHKWNAVSILAKSELGQLIIAAQAKNPWGGVCLQEPTVKSVYNDKRTGHYSPRPPMLRAKTSWVDSICQTALGVAL